MTLRDYVVSNTERGECNCGMCIDRGERPDPKGHTVDMMMFKVAVKEGATKEVLTKLIKEHHGDFVDLDPLDGEEHNYMQLGAWIGDQGLALQFMALGTGVGLFGLLSPKTMLPPGVMDEDQMKQMATAGFLSIQAKK
jgi:hypothetical protein